MISHARHGHKLQCSMLVPSSFHLTNVRSVLGPGFLAPVMSLGLAIPVERHRVSDLAIAAGVPRTRRDLTICFIASLMP
jgi:hypothetical protein